jgi:hypothetical protein
MADTATGWDLVKIAFGFVFGLASGAMIPLAVEWLKRRLFGPRLEVIIKEGESFTPVSQEPGMTPGPFPSRYMRACVKNIGQTTAKNCRAYLIRVDEIAYGELKPTKYRDTLRLRWAYEDEEELHGGVDILPGVFLYFDIMSTKSENGRDLTMLQVAKVRGRFVDLLKFKTHYRFTILVAADATEPKQIIATVAMGDTWENFSVTSWEPVVIRGAKPASDAV